MAKCIITGCDLQVESGGMWCHGDLWIEGDCYIFNACVEGGERFSGSTPSMTKGAVVSSSIMESTSSEEG